MLLPSPKKITHPQQNLLHTDKQLVIIHPMKTPHPSLGDQIARLHGTMQTQEKCAWIPTAIHTLIMAALARIFTRLEALLQLWQSGTLPLPTPAPRPRPQHPARQSVPRPTTARCHPRARTARPRPATTLNPNPARATAPANPPPTRALTPSNARPPAKIFYKPLLAPHQRMP